MVWLLLHPFAERVGQVVAFVAALDPVFNVGFLLAEFGHERGEFGVHVFPNGVLELLEPHLHVLLAFEFHVLLLEPDFLGVTAHLRQHAHNLELRRAFGHILLDLHLVHTHEQFRHLLLDLFGAVRLANDPQQVLV